MRTLTAITLTAMLTACTTPSTQTTNMKLETSDLRHETQDQNLKYNNHTPSDYYYDGWLKTNIDYAIFQQAPETGGYILEIQPAKNYQDSTIYELDNDMNVRRILYRNGGITMMTIQEPTRLARTQKTIEETLQQIIKIKNGN